MGKYYVKKHIQDFIRSRKYCYYCQSHCEEIEIEHIIPLSNNGDCKETNLTASCKKCNLYKSDFSIEVFLNRIIIKRQKTYFKLKSLINKAFNISKRHGKNNDDYLVLFLKITEYKTHHTYYTSIINSITHKKYILYHERMD